MIEETYKGYGIGVVATYFANQKSYERPSFTVQERRDDKWEVVHSDKGDISERYDNLKAAQDAAVTLARKWIDDNAND